MPDDLGALGSLIGVDAAKEWRGALSAARDSSYARERDIRTALDEATAAMQAQRQGQVNLPLLMWAQGIGMPTRSGALSESMSQGLAQAGPAIQQQRNEETQQQGALQKLRMAGIDAQHGGAMERVGLANAPLDMLAKIGPLGLQQQKLALEMRDREAARRAFIESQGGAVSPAPSLPGAPPIPMASPAPSTSVVAPPSPPSAGVGAPSASGVTPRAGGAAEEFGRLAAIYGQNGDFVRAREYQEKAIAARAMEARAVADAANVERKEAAAAAETARKEATAADQAKITGVDSLRKEIDALPQVKAWKDVAPAFGSMIKSSQLNSKAADLDMIYGLAKIMDPGSVVREGEMTMVKGTGGVFDWLRSLVNQVDGGAALTPGVRANILEIARNRAGEYRSAVDTAIAPYEPIIKDRGWNPEHAKIGILPMPTYDPASIGQTPRVQGGPGAAPQTAWPSPPSAAIDMFKANQRQPGEREKFDAIFGPGAADRVLGAR